MALVSMYGGEQSDLTPEQAARLESVFLSRRATDSRRHRDRAVTQAEYLAETGGGQQDSSPAPSETVPLEPVPVQPPVRKPHTSPSVERRLSLEAMARTLTGKGKR